MLPLAVEISTFPPFLTQTFSRSMNAIADNNLADYFVSPSTPLRGGGGRGGEVEGGGTPVLGVSPPYTSKK